MIFLCMYEEGIHIKAILLLGLLCLFMIFAQRMNYCISWKCIPISVPLKEAEVCECLVVFNDVCWTSTVYLKMFWVNKDGKIWTLPKI